jgi:hypothetical protein
MRKQEQTVGEYNDVIFATVNMKIKIVQQKQNFHQTFQTDRFGILIYLGS